MDPSHVDKRNKMQIYTKREDQESFNSETKNLYIMIRAIKNYLIFHSHYSKYQKFKQDNKK